jgi:hypothetical protein
MLARGTGRSLELVMVLPGNLFHALRHESPAAEDRDLGGVGSGSRPLGPGVRDIRAGGAGLALYLCQVLFYGLRIAIRRGSGLPKVGQLFLGQLS